MTTQQTKGLVSRLDLVRQARFERESEALQQRFIDDAGQRPVIIAEWFDARGFDDQKIAEFGSVSAEELSSDEVLRYGIDGVLELMEANGGLSEAGQNPLLVRVADQVIQHRISKERTALSDRLSRARSERYAIDHMDVQVAWRTAELEGDHAGQAALVGEWFDARGLDAEQIKARGGVDATIEELRSSSDVLNEMMHAIAGARQLARDEARQIELQQSMDELDELRQQLIEMEAIAEEAERTGWTKELTQRMNDAMQSMRERIDAMPPSAKIAIVATLGGISGVVITAVMSHESMQPMRDSMLETCSEFISNYFDCTDNPNKAQSRAKQISRVMAPVVVKVHNMFNSEKTAELLGAEVALLAQDGLLDPDNLAEDLLSAGIAVGVGAVAADVAEKTVVRLDRFIDFLADRDGGKRIDAQKMKKQLERSPLPDEITLDELKAAIKAPRTTEAERKESLELLDDLRAQIARENYTFMERVEERVMTNPFMINMRYTAGSVAVWLRGGQGESQDAALVDGALGEAHAIDPDRAPQPMSAVDRVLKGLRDRVPESLRGQIAERIVKISKTEAVFAEHEAGQSPAQKSDALFVGEAAAQREATPTTTERGAAS